MAQKKSTPSSVGNKNTPLLAIAGVAGAIAGLLLFTKKGSAVKGPLESSGEPTIT